MATLIVKDTAGLKVALNSAQAGDTIKLAAGDYTAFTLNSVKFGGAGVTITSLDPANEAKLNGFELRGCEGLNFQGLELKSAQGQINPYQIISSSRINLDNLDVHGSLDGDAQNDGGGILVRGSNGVTITDSEFHQLEYGIAHIDSRGVKIDGNKFHEIQEDGVRGGGTSQIQVTNNVFTNFDPVDGDHPDAIQFWTTQTTASATDITVSGNLVLRGDGGVTQGIFFRDQVGTLPYKNVVVADNLIVGGMANGILILGADGVKLSGNIVAALPGQASGIGLNKVANVTLTDNKASQFAFTTTTITNMTNVNSVVLAPVTDGGASLVQAFIAANTEVLELSTAQDLMGLVQDALAAIEAVRVDVQVITGTAGNDTLKTLVDRDTFIDAGAGNDIIDSGGAGHNTLSGGAGNDMYRLNSEHDVVIEAADGGYDQVYSSTNITLSDHIEKLVLTGNARVGVGNAQNNSITGTAGGDTLSAMGGNDIVSGNDGDDSVLGGDGVDTLNGGNGADTLQGGEGTDQLRGDAGSDSLSGGDGADSLSGNAGADSLSGGLGADVFSFGEGDIALGETIFDFSRVQGDKINVQVIDANVNAAGNQNFAFIGASAFTKVAGQLRYEVSGTDSYVMGDVNGDGVADFKLLLKGVNSFQSSDFTL